MNTPLWMWLGFFAVVIGLLLLDLGILHRRQRDISVKESLWLSLGYVVVSLCFGLAITFYIGIEQGRDFFTGYCIEKSLSLDNILIIAMVFLYFRIPRLYQHRVLFWGVAGVVVLRGLMIALGAGMITHFHVILYFLGVFLIFTGLRILYMREKQKTMEENNLLRWLSRRIPTTAVLHSKSFFVYEPGTLGGMVRKATPLLLTLVFIELADIVFAVDSIPAVFAVTTDPFIVYTSNIFAILGLRALYFALSAMLYRFTYLKYALAIVLIFIGGKILLATFVAISSNWSLAVTLVLLSGGVIVSLYKNGPGKPEPF